MSQTEILFISTYPPRECGIATYTHDLIQAIKEKYQPTFKIRICVLENSPDNFDYPFKPFFRLNTDEESSYWELAREINRQPAIQLVIIEHEFGLFEVQKLAFDSLLKVINQPILLAVHTVLPFPNAILQVQMQSYAKSVSGLIVMTQLSAQILQSDYQIDSNKIHVIPHGTHLLQHGNKFDLKASFNLQGKIILSTFGFIGASKSIETTLEALPAIIEKYPNVLFLIIGKTHPNVLATEGEKYRKYLESIVKKNHLGNHVQWINTFLPTLELLDYLSLTDIYLFTSNDPNQAVSGTFSYAISSGCPIISTRIPHAIEVLKPDMGILIDFNNSEQLVEAAFKLLDSGHQRTQMRINSLQNMAISAWENSAIRHMNLCKELIPSKDFKLIFKWPSIDLKHIQRMTTSFGMIQFAHINEPDLSSGYTIDDNARALIALCEQYQLSKSVRDLLLIGIYLDFILFCQQENGSFLNYVSYEQEFTEQNGFVNLEDSIGRTVWALGFVLSHRENLPSNLIKKVELIFSKALESVYEIHSTRAMAFIIKGIYYANNARNLHLMELMANRLAGMYAHEANDNWSWFESSLSYANSLLPEAMLRAWQTTNNLIYRNIALKSFDFLLRHTFDTNGIHVISNEFWLKNGDSSYQKETAVLSTLGGEQAIDVCYSILALHAFYEVLGKEEYLDKMHLAFDWFLGKNHLNQIMYNPSTGGCYDGLELNNVNLNQGAESTISYLMARQIMEKVKEKVLIQKNEMDFQIVF